MFFALLVLTPILTPKNVFIRREKRPKNVTHHRFWELKWAQGPKVQKT